MRCFQKERACAEEYASHSQDALNSFAPLTTQRIHAQMQSSKFSPIWQWATQLLSSVLARLQKMIRVWLLWVVTAGPVPSHIAFIMDGNRRFADRLHIDRHIGHSHGFDALLRTLKDCFDLHVKTVTLYAFSIDNFQRPPDEVSALMDLMQTKLEALVEKEGLASEYGIRVRILGDLSLLPHGARTAAEKAMAVTSKNSSSVLNLCISYTSTHEIAQSVQQTCRNALNALGNDLGFDGNLDSGIVVTDGCKAWNVPTTLSSHVSKCRCALDHSCSDTDGFSELSKSDPANGMQECLHAQLKEGHDCAGNSDLVPGSTHHSVGGKNHRTYACDKGLSQALEEGKKSFEVSADDVMAGESMTFCNSVRSSTDSTGLRRRISNGAGISENSCPQDSNSVSTRGCDSSESQTTSKNGDAVCIKMDIKEGGHSMGCDFADCSECKPYECQQSLKSSSTSNSSMKRQLHSCQPLHPKDSFVADKADKARKEDCLANYTRGEHCHTDDRILELVKESVSEEEIEKHLYTGPSCPPPDLLIRTSGETRLSNFLLWQTSFSHLAFCKVLWPEFSFQHLILIILEYQRSLPTLLRKRQNRNVASFRN